mgnify:CR=1 FL=1
MQRDVRVIDLPLPVRYNLISVDAVAIPGIGTGLHAANDQLGVQFAIPVPVYGQIRDLIYYDRDDEGTGVEIWLFRSSVVSPAGDDAAFALGDTDLLNVEAVIPVGSFFDAVNGQVGREDALGIDYYAPDGFLYGLVKNLAAQTIVAAPQIALRIEPASDLK